MNVNLRQPKAGPPLAEICEYTSVKFLFLSILLVSIDQLSKYLIRSKGGFYNCNPNIAWSIQVPGYVFWFFGLFIVCILIFSLVKKIIIHNYLFIILILSGAISNIIDRIFFGCVIDFIDLKFWPVFNLADVFIVSGAIFLLVKFKKL
ncbi:MAG: signal peptidase II [bacterium]|nr:signal peptidase II [bacterium]